MEQQEKDRIYTAKRAEYKQKCYELQNQRDLVASVYKR